MGCGNQSQNHASDGIVVINYSVNRSRLESARLASPIRIKLDENTPQEPRISELIAQSNCKSLDPNQVIESSLFQFSKKEDWNEISRIQTLREDHEAVRNLSLKFQSPTEFAINTQEVISIQGFNFDFLNESSYSTKANKQIISDVFHELETIK